MAEAQHLTEQQRKWMASVRESLERNTGRSLAQWVAVARTCPHAKPMARRRWFKEVHGVGQNYASLILSEAFPSAERGMGEPADLLDQLWKDAELRRIYGAVAARAQKLEGTITAPRKTFSSFARSCQYAALRPSRGAVRLGLAVEPDASPRLARPAKEGWSERLHAVTVLSAVKDVDAEIGRLLKAAWERS